MTYVAPPLVHAEVLVIEETLQQKADRIAKEEGFDPQIVRNVIDSETGGTWDCSLVGKAGELGCLQIIPELHDVDPMNFEEAVRYFIDAYKAGNGWWWTGCSCIQTAKAFGVKVKGNAADLVPNVETPQKGDLVLFRYKSGVSHVAVVKSLSEGVLSVTEGNLEPCQISSRTVPVTDQNIVGYWRP